jgi:hypothetical protein
LEQYQMSERSVYQWIAFKILYFTFRVQVHVMFLLDFTAIMKSTTPVIVVSRMIILTYTTQYNS